MLRAMQDNQAVLAMKDQLVTHLPMLVTIGTVKLGMSLVTGINCSSLIHSGMGKAVEVERGHVVQIPVYHGSIVSLTTQLLVL